MHVSHFAEKINLATACFFETSFCKPSVMRFYSAYEGRLSRLMKTKLKTYNRWLIGFYKVFNPKRKVFLMIFDIKTNFLCLSVIRQFSCTAWQNICLLDVTALLWISPIVVKNRINRIWYVILDDRISNENPTCKSSQIAFSVELVNEETSDLSRIF